MAVAGSAVADSDAADSSGPPGRKLMMMALILAVVAGSVGLWQWRSPNAFAEQGSGVGIYNPVGTAALVGVAGPQQQIDPAVLTVHSVEPQITEGDAQVDVIVCHRGQRKTASAPFVDPWIAIASRTAQRLGHGLAPMTNSSSGFIPTSRGAS